MKFIKIISGVLFVFLLSVYIVVFTPLNKSTIVPIIKSEISKASKIKNVEIPIFELSFSNLKMQLLLENQAIDVDASFDIFSKTLDTSYKIDIKDLSTFDYLSGQKLKGTFFTEGKLQGTFDNLKLDGDANVADGNIKYKLNIDKNDINNIAVNINSLDLPTLLNMINQPKYVDGKFNANVNISSLKLEQVKFAAIVNQGKFNVLVFKDNLKLNIPKSDFTLDTNINLQNKAGDFNFNFNSKLIKLITNGNIDINSLKIDTKYKVLIDQLAMLEPLIGSQFNGSFQTNGTIKGEKKSMVVDGTSNLAKGQITYNVILKDLEVDRVKGSIKKVKLDELLYIVNQPKYAKADLNVDFNINSLKNLDGQVKTTLDNGLLNKKIVKRDFNITLPKNPIFNLEANTNLNKNIIDTKVTLNSFAAKLQTTKTVFDTKTAILTTDYLLSVSDLKNLYFVINQKMRGDIKIAGDIKFDKYLTVSFNSKKFGGNINGTFIKDKLSVKITNIDSINLLNMMYYPEIFKSKVNLSLDYDTTSKKGISNIDMKDGNFLANKLSQTINKLIKKDLTTEIYKTVTIKTKINDLILDSTLFMQSKNSEIKSNKMYMDLKKSYIDAGFDIKYYNFDLGLKLKGDLTSPKVKIDAGKLLKSKAKQEVKKVIEKKLGDKLKKDLGGLLKGLFK